MVDSDREKISFKTNIVGICVNILLFVFKFVVGSISKSISIITDSFNNLTDSFSNIISLIGVYLSNKPADKDHPFGHGRIEYISAFVVAFLVLQVGVFSFVGSIKKLFNKEALYVNSFVLLVLSISIIVKLLLSLFYEKISKKINSNIFKAASFDSISDSIITLGTLVAVIVYKFFNFNIDAIVGIIVSIIIIVNGVKIVKETLEPLIGEAIDTELYDKVEEFVKSYEEVINTHDLIIHNYGPEKYMCSIHVEVDKTKDIEYLHEIIDRIEKDIKEKLGLLLVIHLDPIDIYDEKLNEYREYINELIDNIKKNRNISDLSYHDLRMVKGQNNSNIIFDIIVPWEYNTGQDDDLIAYIKLKIEKHFNNITVVFNIEKSYK